MMGLARQPPKPHYGRKFQIADHAVQRFRERVEEEHMARGDQDLMNLLDERIQNAARTRDVIDHTNDRSGPSTIYFIESRDGQTSLAVVRNNTCVTVLEEEMLDVKLRDRTWTDAPINTPFKTALAGVVVRSQSPTPAPDFPILLAQPPRHAPIAHARDVVTTDQIAIAGAVHAKAMLEVSIAGSQVIHLELELCRIENELTAAQKRSVASVDAEVKAHEALRDLIREASKPGGPT